jgi:hypothetical protein
MKLGSGRDWPTFMPKQSYLGTPRKLLIPVIGQFHFMTEPTLLVVVTDNNNYYEANNKFIDYFFSSSFLLLFIFGRHRELHGFHSRGLPSCSTLTE